MKQLTEAEMLHKAAAYCSAAERCRQEVEKKIVAAGFPPDVTERILERLVREKFIDEVRFCRSFVHDKLRFNKWGRIRIGYELRMKRIPNPLIADALDEIDEELYLHMLQTLLKDKKKTVRGKDNRDTFYKLLRYAAGRGFENELILKCLHQSGYDEEADREDMD
ncbi:regulatory protein RecX [Parabacteroides sp. PF5-6]|uniref:regulatory protein RecX n=1 Tax=Parabacteroides sp. PF5-6 TaxID=1742403 RepID=UPI0024071EA7|nr:regulatory protein RecX [Parabacteroides sp. PF5-6]MDF9829351.1 regulatory protein [Parabacteroides sp. PF5-6]